MDNQQYDSKKDTETHIVRVRELIFDVITQLLIRAHNHDESKLLTPEKEVFDEYTPKLKDSSYGSKEYQMFLKEMEVALKHHYEQNKHHPEHFKNGINDMTLIDLIEMLCDWKAATERHANGDVLKSLKINKTRFKINEQLCQILENTYIANKWLEK